MGYGAA